MASPWFFVVSPNRSGRAGVRRSTSALSHHRADGGDVGGFGLGRARGEPLDSRSTSGGGQRLQAQYVGRRGGAGHGLVRRRDGNRGTAISLGPRPKLQRVLSGRSRGGAIPGSRPGHRCVPLALGSGWRTPSRPPPDWLERFCSRTCDPTRAHQLHGSPEPGRVSADGSNLGCGTSCPRHGLWPAL